MKKLFPYLVYWVFFLIFFQGQYGIAQDLKFNHLTIDDGLSQNAVFSILQDSQGFMWFGTKDGLNRYDGRNFVIHQHNPFDSTTISDPYVTSLLEDSHNRIWAGTLNGDLNIFEKETELFYRLSIESAGSGPHFSNTITGIIEGSDGKIWIGTHGGGLVQITPTLNNAFNFKQNHFLNDPNRKQTLSHDVVNHLLIDKDDILWVATENGLNKYNESDDTFTHFIFDTTHSDAPVSSVSNRVGFILEGKNENLWLGTQSGLVKFNRRNENYQFYPNKYEVFRYGWGSVNQIIEDQTGTLWLGTSSGLLEFNRLTTQYIYHQHDPMNPNSLSFDLVSSMVVDQTGILWIGTIGQGINILDFNANKFQTLAIKPPPNSRISGFSVRSVLEDNQGDVWISADVLYRWNRQTGEIRSFETSANLPSEFGNTDAYSMIQGSDENIWAASASGLYRYNPITGQTNLFNPNPDDITDRFNLQVNAVFEDRDSTIWIAHRNYFSKLVDKERGVFKHFEFIEPEFSFISLRPVIYRDYSGSIWLGTANGLFRFDPENESFISYRNDPLNTESISNNHIKSIQEDPANPELYLWIGTSGGLNKFSFETQAFEHYTVLDGLPNEVVYAILPDNDKNLWLSTNKGLSRFDPKMETFRNFDIRDGLQSNEFNTGAYFRSNSGELFFGGIRGLNHFYPGDIQNNPHQPPIVLTGLKIGDTNVTYKTAPKILHSSVSTTNQIDLTHEQSVITFEFASLNYSAPDKNQYAYMLDGYNDDWFSSGNLASATYTNLPHGEYTFRVRGSNNDGVWNNEGLALAVIVTPPWWLTWWAYGIYGFLFLSILYSARRYELNRFNLKNQLKIERIQTDTLRNLNQLKSHFFTNISHEFRTPLTLIIGQIETLLGTDVNFKEKQKLESVNRNAEKLLDLINQLLDLSKLEAGKMQLDAKSQNIVSFLNNILYSFESLAESKNISLNFSSLQSTIPVMFDSNKMEKVFINLLSNAFKFTESGGRIDLSIQKTDSRFVEISLKDTGIGIPENRLHHIFDRFYQADPSNTRKHEGTGIGLSLAQELIHLHDGTISVKSEEGTGTEFTIRLSCEEKEFSYNSEIILSEEKCTDSKMSKIAVPNFDFLLSEHHEIILVVEDNAEVRSFISEQFKSDYKILEAENGIQGYAISRETIPDLIITDLMMPEMNGYELSKKIRHDEKTSHIPIIMLTAKVGLDPKIEGLEIGIDAYITKPFRVREMQTRVKNLIEAVFKSLLQQHGVLGFVGSVKGNQIFE